MRRVSEFLGRAIASRLADRLTVTLEGSANLALAGPGACAPTRGGPLNERAQSWPRQRGEPSSPEFVVASGGALACWRNNLMSRRQQPAPPAAMGPLD